MKSGASPISLSIFIGSLNYLKKSVKGRSRVEFMARISCLAFFGLLLISIPLSAHHGNSAFDNTKTLTLKGTVTEWVWANPHCWLKFDATDDKGNVVHWVAETSNPPDMVNRGWARSSFKPGDEITVTLTPVKTGQPVGRVNKVVLPNGQELSAGGAPPPKPADNSPKP